MTLPPLIRALGLSGIAVPKDEEREARRTILNAATTYLQSARAEAEAEYAPVYDDLAFHYRKRLAAVAEDSDESAPALREFNSKYVELSQRLLEVERQTAVRLRNERRISDELLRELERELDLGEARYIAKNNA
jgi:hypothetical protein